MGDTYFFNKNRNSNQPDDWFEEDQQGFDEHGWMDNIQSLDVLLIPEIARKTTKKVLYR